MKTQKPRNLNQKIFQPIDFLRSIYSRYKFVGQKSNFFDVNNLVTFHFHRFLKKNAISGAQELNKIFFIYFFRYSENQICGRIIGK